VIIAARSTSYIQPQDTISPGLAEPGRGVASAGLRDQRRRKSGIPAAHPNATAQHGGLRFSSELMWDCLLKERSAKYTPQEKAAEVVARLQHKSTRSWKTTRRMCISLKWHLILQGGSK
jgi:hypothetical protein